MLKLHYILLLLVTICLPLQAQPNTSQAEAQPPITDGNPGFIGSIQFSPDGKHLAAIVREQWRGERTSAAKSQFSLWEVATGRLLWTSKSPINDGPAPLFSPDGKTVICYGSQLLPKGGRTEGADAQFSAWEVATGKLLPVLELGENDYVRNLFFSADGKWLMGNIFDDNAPRSQSRNKVKVWEASSGKFERIAGALPELTTYSEWVAAPHFIATPTGQTPQEQRKNKLDVWSISDFNLHRSLSLGKEEEVQLCAISLDGTKVALQTFLPGARDQQIYLWDLVRETSSTVVYPELTDFHVTSLEFSPDSQRLFGCGRVLYKAGGGGTVLWVWNAQTGELEGTVEADMKTRQRGGQLPLALFSPDGQHFAVFRTGDKIELRNVLDGALVRLFE